MKATFKEIGLIVSVFITMFLVLCLGIFIMTKAIVEPIEKEISNNKTVQRTVNVVNKSGNKIFNNIEKWSNQP